MSNTQKDGIIISINGPVVKCKLPGSFIYEVVKLGEIKLVSEVIQLENDIATVQCYEETTGLRINDPVFRTHNLLCIECGPGLLHNIMDGIGRPLKEISNILAESDSIYQRSRDYFIPKGITAPTLNHKKEYDIKFNPELKVGDTIVAGDIFASTQENELIECKLMLPEYGLDAEGNKVNCPGGVIKYIAQSGLHTIDEISLKLDFNGQELTYQYFFYQPVRQPRKYIKKLTPDKQLIIGQRVLDGLFSLAQGSCAAIPGAFGCGKTVISQSTAKYSNCDIIIYVACGERGNECSEVLQDFPSMTIIKNGKESNLMNRTCLVANTSNLPVASREASIYTGITIAEYFRDMGYNVCLMADSTSRFAEALREISARNNELPSEQNYPASLQAKLAQFYERAGKVELCGQDFTLKGKPAEEVEMHDGNRTGSISVIGAVSPSNGDFGDVVVIYTLQIVNVFWGLTKALAKKKHFPSVDYKISYTKCDQIIKEPIKTYRAKILDLLQQSSELQETAQLVGFDALGDQEKLIIAVCKTITEGFLQQNGYTDFDRFCPLEKTTEMMNCLCKFYDNAKIAVDKYGFEKFQAENRNLWDRLNRMKELNSNKDGLQKVLEQLKQLSQDIETISE